MAYWIVVLFRIASFLFAYQSVANLYYGKYSSWDDWHQIVLPILAAGFWCFADYVQKVEEEEEEAEEEEEGSDHSEPPPS